MSEARDELAARIRERLGLLPGLVEKRMFGGLCFLVDGNMVVGVMKDGALLARVGKDGYAEALALPGASPMTMGGRDLTGFVEVRGEGIDADVDLAGWIDRCRRFVATLPPK